MSKRKIKNVYKLFPAALALCSIIIVAPFLKLQGFENDVNTFWAWMSKLITQPLSGFYSKDYFADYFPLYLYVLRVTGYIGQWLGIQSIAGGGVVLLKMPSLICYAIFIFWFTRQWLKDQKIDSLESFAQSNFVPFAALMLNPAILYNYAGFSQVDAIFTVIATICFYNLLNNRWEPACMAYGLLFAMKPQALFFAPILFVYTVLRRKDLFQGKASSFLKGVGSALFWLAVLFVPFWWNNPAGMVEHFMSGLQSYNYSTVNAFNFFAVTNGNWIPLEEYKILGLGPYGVYIASVLVTGLYLARSFWKTGAKSSLKNLVPKQILLLGAIFVMSLFLFFPKMHERYVLVVFPFFYLLGLQSPRMFLAYIAITLATTINQAFVIDHFYGSKNAVNGPVIYGCFWIYFFGFTQLLVEFRESVRGKEIHKLTVPWPKIQSYFSFAKNRLRVRDESMWLITILVTSSLLVLYNLGSCSMIQTGEQMNEKFTVHFDGAPTIRKVWVFSRGAEGHIFTQCADQKTETNFDMGYSWYYAWKETTIPDCATDLHFRAEIANGGKVGEILFYDHLSKPIKPKEICFEKRGCMPPEKTALFDEFKDSIYKNNFQYGTYFDEVYYARAVDELISGKYPWENTHPALSKFMMTWWVQLTSFNPFQWRFPNALIGILIPLLVFMMVLRLIGDRFVAIAAGILSTVEWTRIALARIATIDVMVCFFIVGAYWFAFEVLRDIYIAQSERKPARISVYKMAALSVFISLALAIKWNSVFMYVTIAGLFFLTFTFLHFQKLNTWRFNLRDVTMLCLAFFVVPFLIYWISFQPFHIYLVNGYTWEQFKQDQVNMYNYHSTLKATHAFSSVFWSWPFLHKPMWFYTDNHFFPGLYYTIAVMGNPAVWWAIFPAIVYLFYTDKIKKYPGLVYFILALFAQFLTWIFASRITFTYHFLPSAIFGTAVIGAFLKEMYQENKWVFYSYVTSIVVLCIMFWPLYTGDLTSRDYVDNFLKWFPSWYF